MSPLSLKVALLQRSPCNGASVDAEVKEVLREIGTLKDQGVSLVVLPELWPRGPISSRASEAFDKSPEILFKLEALVSGLDGVAVMCGLPERVEVDGEKRLFNSSFFISRQSPPAIYRKIHLFPPFGEDKVFEPGGGPRPIWYSVAGVELGIGPTICFDLRFPELFRQYAIEGCILLVCHALWPKERIGHFSTLLRARAIENQCFCIGVNAAGSGFGGRSMVVGPDGHIVAQAGEEKETVVCELDLEAIGEWRGKFLTARPRQWLESASHKILTLEALREEVRRRKPLGQQCVFTNGCFDILHAGHVAYLEEARRQGDFLVLGMNSDASIKAIKGPLRPINPEAMRAAVVAGLESVDYVVLFDDPTPIKLIEALLPDVLVKGEDWAEDEIVGAKTVKAHGGRVVRIPFVHDISTTKIIGNIIKGHS